MTIIRMFLGLNSNWAYGGLVIFYLYYFLIVCEYTY